MIRKFTVKAFKSLVDVELELGQINVFIGANGSGKSNLLEALGVLGAAASGRVDDESLLRRGVRPGVPKLYKSSFQGQSARGSIRFEAQSEASSYAVELNNPLKDPSPAWRFTAEKLENQGARVIGRSRRSKDYQERNPEAGLAALQLVNLLPEEPAAMLLERLRSYCIYTLNTNTLQGIVADPQPREPLGLSGGRLPEACLELIRSRHAPVEEARQALFSLIDWMDSYGAGEPGIIPLSPSVSTTRKVLRFRDRYMAKGRNELTAYDASEGALYVLAMCILAVHPKAPKMLAVDNADHGLNPRLVRTLMTELCSWVVDDEEQQKQLLFTTHNPLVLDGLPLMDDRIRLFTVDRTRRGTTQINRVTVTKELLAKAEEGWTLSRLWVMGHLGGVPNV